MNKNCFAYKKGITAPTCSALKTMLCKDGACPFYRSRFEITQAQIEQDILAYSSHISYDGERRKHGTKANSESARV